MSNTTQGNGSLEIGTSEDQPLTSNELIAIIREKFEDQTMSEGFCMGFALRILWERAPFLMKCRGVGIIAAPFIAAIWSVYDLEFVRGFLEIGVRRRMLALWKAGRRS